VTFREPPWTAWRTAGQPGACQIAARDVPDRPQYAERDRLDEIRRSALALDPRLLEILACPEDKGPLLYFEDEGSLYNARLRRRYRIENDIPVMLIDESEQVSDDEHDRLVARAEAEGIAPTFDPAT
jgi:uncharacterized protein YbaR (Trm112 family)